MNDKEARGPVEMRNLVGELRLAGSRLCHRAADALEGLLGEREPCATVSEDDRERIAEILQSRHPSIMYRTCERDAEAILAAGFSRADVPDAVICELTEAIRFTVEYTGNDMLPAIEGWDWYDALVKYAPEVAQAFVDKPIHLPKQTEVEAERDAALAAIERIRVAVSGHPECDRYEEGDVISCGWKSAYASVVAALDGAPEPEANIEYGVLTPEREVWHVTDDLDEARTVAKDNPGDSVEYRHRVGPWLPVEGESK